jgi:hypothetical protein
MSWTRETPPIFEGEDELQLKLQYAAIVARNPNAKLTAGYQVFPGADNYGRALQAQAWLSDPIVQEEISRLVEGAEAVELLPDPSAVKLEVLQAARSATDPKAKEGLYKLYLDSVGALPKGGTNINVNQDNRVVQVLRVPTRDVTREDDEDFERRFYIQQNALIADAKSNRPAIAG